MLVGGQAEVRWCSKLHYQYILTGSIYCTFTCRAELDYHNKRLPKYAHNTDTAMKGLIFYLVLGIM